MANFNRELFGYSRVEVDKKMEEDALKMSVYQKDLEYLKKKIREFEIDIDRDL